MYLRITSRCNMTCEHCAFSCTNKGSDMSLEVFRAALSFAENHGEYITIGGGEPTIHPQFWHFFSLALAKFNDKDYGMYIVTNGKETETALALAVLARGGILGVSLSQDIYHDEIEPEVIEAFTKNKYANTTYGYVHRWNVDKHDMRAISEPGLIYNSGRAKQNNIGNRPDSDCFCDDIVVEPNGRLWMCGHRKVSFGTIQAPAIPKWYWERERTCSEIPEHEQQAA